MARGGRGGNRRLPQTREVMISKALSFLLRHGGLEEGVEMDEGGWANVADVLNWRRLSSQKVTFAELQNIVTSNDKNRFSLEPKPDHDLPTHSTQVTANSDPYRWRVRASQGHSITTISDSAIYIPILLTDSNCPSYLVHGTYEKPWLEIKKSGGLKRMNRTHIHFADRLPKPLPPLDPVYQSKSKAMDEGDKLISGMRPGATIVVWVDVKKSLMAGVEWWRSRNGVFLTKGLESKEKGKEGEWMLGFEFFKWVEKRGKKDGEIMFGEKVVGVGKPVEEDEVGTKKSALTVVEDGKTGKMAEREENVEAVPVVKDSWDDGDD